MEFSRSRILEWLAIPFSRDLPHPGIEPRSLALWEDSLQSMKVKVAQLCLTVCDPMGNRVHGVLQARILEWVAFPFYRESSQPRD